MTHPSNINNIEEFYFDDKKSYIYFLVDEFDIVVYVGKSKSFLARYTSHLRNEYVYKMWKDGRVVKTEKHLKKFKKCYILEVHQDNLECMEEDYIKTYLPKYNICTVSVNVRKEIERDEKAIKKFMIDNNMYKNIKREGSKWLIQVK